MIDLPPGYTVAKEEAFEPFGKEKYLTTVYRDAQNNWVWEQFQDDNEGRAKAWDRYEWEQNDRKPPRKGYFAISPSASCTVVYGLFDDENKEDESA